MNFTTLARWIREASNITVRKIGAVHVVETAQVKRELAQRLELHKLGKRVGKGVAVCRKINVVGVSITLQLKPCLHSIGQVNISFRGAVNLFEHLLIYHLGAVKNSKKCKPWVGNW